MRDDINLLNLTNGMNYSIHQLEHLAAYSRKAGAGFASAAPEPKFDAAKAGKYRVLLGEVLGALERDVDPDRETVRQALLLRKEILPPPKFLGPRPPEGGRDIDRLVDQTRDLLFESQRQVLLDYKPCLIPPKNLKDPVRVGQAHDNGLVVKSLTKLREIPAEKWERNRGEIVEQTLSRIEEHNGRFPDGERGTKLAKMTDLLERARALSAVDFELQKNDFAKEFEPFGRKDALKHELDAMLGDEAVINQKIRAFLLDPRAASLYETRLAQLKAAPRPEAVDLDTISAADHCKDGKCAIDD
ncbi:MAG: hypothetical protein HYY93_10960 [Planctomycetes bacterium]|nr:hypothetical protein [Planctomycetota bacterium]